MEEVTPPADCIECIYLHTNITIPEHPKKVCVVARPGEYIKNCPCMLCLVKVLCIEHDTCLMFRKIRYFHWKSITDKINGRQKFPEEIEWDKEIENVL